MHKHFAYGLQIASDIPLLEFPPGRGTVEVFVRYVAKPTGKPVPVDRGYEVEVGNKHARFWFKESGEFLILDGRTILIHPAPDADETLTRLYVEGMIMAMLLYQRGLSVLHASVVNIGGRAVAFLGHVGAGKSSLAAAMHARGHAVVSDDNAAIDIESGKAIVSPAYPYVKLFPAIAASLGYGSGGLHELHSSQNKVAGAVTRKFSSRPLPLERVYILGRDRAPDIAPVFSSRLLVDLIRNSVPTRWGCNGDREHLERCANLAGAVQAFTVRTFDSLEALPKLAERIEAHCGLGEDLPASTLAAGASMAHVSTCGAGTLPA